jgi:3-deoxy-7-phosphoheptulonate synthase
MLVLMEPTASAREIDSVCARITHLGFTPHVMPGSQTTAIGITGNPGPIPAERLRDLPGIARLIPVSEPYKLVSRRIKPEGTRIEVRGTVVGGPGLVVIAGPCSVESRQQLLETAHAVKEAGAHMLRGGAFKPRTSPYSFQGLKQEGLALLAEAREATGLAIVTEVKDTETLAMVEEVADILQIGARNMHNFTLLEAVGRSRKPVLLKRGMAATIKELLMAAEYIVSGGNHNVILCERGIRTFETLTRNTMDVGAIAVLKHLSHLPVFGDPSHGIGIAEYVPAMARAAVATGADGLLVEVHSDPKTALSDGDQSLSPESFAAMMAEVVALGAVLSRPLAPRDAS